MEKRCNSLATPRFRVRDRSGKPAGLSSGRGLTQLFVLLAFVLWWRTSSAQTQVTSYDTSWVETFDDDRLPQLDSLIAADSTDAFLYFRRGYLLSRSREL